MNCYKIILLVIALCFSVSQDGVSDTLNVKDIKNILNSRYESILSLESDGSIDFDSPTNSGSGSIISSIKKPDSIFAKLKGPFGITGALILITRSNFIYYNVQDNFVIKGPASREYLRYIIRVGLDFNELMYVLTGSFYLNDSIYTEHSLIKVGEQFILQVKDTINNRAQTVYINEYNKTISKYELFENSDTASVIIEYSDYRNKSGISFPYKVTVSRPSQNEFMSLEYSELIFNSGEFKFKLNPPKSAKIIIWD